MKLTLSELRALLAEAFNDDVEDDPSWDKKSTYVPDDVKKKVSSWLSDMGMSRKKRSRASRVP